MLASMAEFPPPGWYEDPTVPDGERWWDGEKWTEQTRVGPATPAAPRSPGSLRRVSDFLGHAFSQVRDKWMDHLVVALLGGLISGAITGLLIGPVVSEIDVVDNSLVGFRAGHLINLALVVVIGGVISSAAALALHRIAWENATGREVSWSEALAYAVSNLSRFIGWMLLGIVPILLAALGSIIAVANTEAGIVAVLFLMAAALWWGTNLVFLPVAYVAEGKGANPIRGAMGIVKGHWWRIFGRLLLLGLIVGIISQAVLNIIGGAAGIGTFGIDFTVDEAGNFEFTKTDLGAVGIVVASMITGVVNLVSAVPQITGSVSIGRDRLT